MNLCHKEEEASLLDILWEHCAENCPQINAPLTEEYQELEKQLSPLPERDRDAAMFAVCCISVEKQRLAFREGVRTGVRLAAEVADK